GDGEEMGRAGDRGAAERQDDVAGDEPRPFGRASGLDRGDHDRPLLGQAGCMSAAAPERELLGSYTNIGAPHPAVSHQLAEHETCRVGPNPKAYPVRSHDAAGVDANTPA